MITILAERTPTAQKLYHCDAWPFVQEMLNQGVYTLAEYRQIAKAKQRNFCIHPGDRYIRIVYKDGGDLCTFRAIPSLDAIATKYDLYDED